MPFAGAFKKLAEYMLGPQQTQGYVVRLGYSWLFGPGSRRPLWSRYYAEQMLLDNQVWFGFNIANGPLLTAKVEVKSPSAEVQQFAQQQFDRLWSQEAPKLLMVRGFGYAGFEVCYKQTDSGRIEFDRLKDFHADDAWPLTLDGRLAGISVAGIKRDDTSVLNQGKVIVRSPKSLWLTNNAQYGQWFGEADTRRAFPPWWDKASENGALDLRRLRNIKDSWVGDVVRYPLGRAFVDEEGRPLSGRDLAREIADNRLSGGAVALPSDTDDKGKELFTYQAPQGISGTRDSQEWIQDLDWDIFDGLLLPREVVEAATTGSGFSGRSFPFLVFLGVGDMRFAQYAAQIKQQFLVPLVAVNFGGSAAKELEVHPTPLVETVGEQMGKMGQPNTSTAKPGPDGQQQQQPPSLKRPPERIAARSQQFSVYDESKHPRGQPDNAGQFASAPGGSSGDAGTTGGDSKPDGKAAWKQFLANAKLRAKEFDKLLPETDVPDLIARLSSDDFDVVDELKDAGNYLVEIGEMTPEAAESLKSLIAEVEGGLLSESEADEADEIAQEHGGEDRDTAIALSQRFADETKYRHAVVRTLGQHKPRPSSPGDEHSRYLRKNKDQVKDLADEILSSIANVVPESMPGRRKALLKAAMERIAAELGDVDESSQFSIAIDPDQEQGSSRKQIRSTAASVSTALSRRINRILKKKRLTAAELAAEIEALLGEFRDIVQRSLHDTLIGAWVDGAGYAINTLPESVWPQEPAVTAPGAAPPKPPKPPKATALLYPDGDGPLIKFEGLEAAVASIQERQVLRPEEFYRLSASAKQQAFTISGDLTEKSIDKVRALLEEDLQRGTSREAFAESVRTAMPSLPISEAHLEQVYRNNTNEAFSQGVERVLDVPAVAEAFPYRAYYAIRDDRVRQNHLSLEGLGLNGTNIFHKDDPTWKKFRPPWEWNCRCGWAAMDIDDAAAAGVREAKDWAGSGTEPVHVAVDPPPFNPPESWDRVGVHA